MENDINTTNTNGDPVDANPSVGDPDTQKVKISPKESIKIRLNEVKQKIISIDPRKKKIALIAVFLAAGTIVLIMLGSFLIPKQVAVPLPTFSPAPTQTDEITGPSEYSEDPEVLRIKDAIVEFDNKAKSTVIREDDLRLPTVDWNITF